MLQGKEPSIFCLKEYSIMTDAEDLNKGKPKNRLSVKRKWASEKHD